MLVTYCFPSLPRLKNPKKKMAKISAMSYENIQQTNAVTGSCFFLDYCNSLYYGMSKSSDALLPLVQNTAAKFLRRWHKFEHVTLILKLVYWLPVHFRTEFKILLYVYKSQNNLAPSSVWTTSSMQWCALKMKQTWNLFERV